MKFDFKNKFPILKLMRLEHWCSLLMIILEVIV